MKEFDNFTIKLLMTSMFDDMLQMGTTSLNAEGHTSSKVSNDLDALLSELSSSFLC